MTSRWNLWVWLECIGVVSGCCCKEVYRQLMGRNSSAELLILLLGSNTSINCV